MKLEPLPTTYRQAEVNQILTALQAGDSCSVVGVGSVGKSNLLRFLGRDEVRQTYLGDAWQTYLFVYVDINKILKYSTWGLFELMIHQLLVELTKHKAEEVILQTIDDLHQRATRPKTQRLALRYLDRALGLACNQLGLHLIFLFDEFDELCRRMSPRGFAALRALRDDYKYHLMYVVATRLTMKRLRDEIGEIEAFEELVSPQTIWLGPYSRDDASFMLRRLASRHQITLAEKATHEVLAATGGHPGLLREGYSMAVAYQSDFFDILTNNPQVQDECQRIWFSLPAGEQQVLVSLIGGGSVPQQQGDVLERLRRKGLVGGPWAGANRIFSSLFAVYIKRQNPTIGAQIHIDRQRRLISVSGRKITGLTPLEYNLIAYLAEKQGQVCTRDELAEYLYPEDAALEGLGVTDNRLDSVVKRLRKRIEPNPKAPRYIITVRGHGFKLQDGPGVDT